MSGIGYQHNKFDTCQDCPDRTVEPNCHNTCKGYLYRKAERDRVNKARRKDFTYHEYKEDVMRKAGRLKEK